MHSADPFVGEGFSYDSYLGRGDCVFDGSDCAGDGEGWESSISVGGWFICGRWDWWLRLRVPMAFFFPVRFLALVAVFSFYFAFSAYRALRLKELARGGECGADRLELPVL